MVDGALIAGRARQLLRAQPLLESRQSLFQAPKALEVEDDGLPLPEPLDAGREVVEAPLDALHALLHLVEPPLDVLEPSLDTSEAKAHSVFRLADVLRERVAKVRDPVLRVTPHRGDGVADGTYEFFVVGHHGNVPDAPDAFTSFPRSQPPRSARWSEREPTARPNPDGGTVAEPRSARL